MQYRQIVLIALCLSALTACSSTPSMPQTEINIPTPRPSECLRACPELPYPASGGEADMGVWRHDVVFVAGECRRLHDICRGAE